MEIYCKNCLFYREVKNCRRIVIMEYDNAVGKYIFNRYKSNSLTIENNKNNDCEYFKPYSFINSFKTFNIERYYDNEGNFIKEIID